MANDLLRQLRGLTDARIALDRAGSSLTSRDWLDLRAAHAAARDAVETELVWPEFPPPIYRVTSRCRDRREYLLRPDLGRRLAEDALLPKVESDVVIVVTDGLSSLAITRHAPAMVEHLRHEFPGAPVVLATLGRVAIGDDIGERMGARVVAILIGERPGLSAADSLGIYITYDPRVGRTDAERNCISNIRHGGLDYAEASRRAAWLIRESMARRLSGVSLKESGQRTLGT